MSTSVFLVAHLQKTVFEIGGIWMHGFPEIALLDPGMLLQEIQKRLPSRSSEYTGWLRDQMWDIVVKSKFDACIVHEPGHDSFIERGYIRVGTYFPLR